MCNIIRNKVQYVNKLAPYVRDYGGGNVLVLLTAHYR